MENEQKHTPLPWRAYSSAVGIEIVADPPNDHFWIARVQDASGSMPKKANADFICRAVNSHDGMLRALKRAKTIVNAARKFIQQANDTGDLGVVRYDDVDTDCWGFEMDAENLIDEIQRSIASAEAAQ